ncbi:MAG: TetR/AcrR family transcriptional regulator [Gallionella sp.]|nr:TetR/AcrR family transcriptional regulator [Gallionella sp.]MDD4959067.1 TetR/AcrR family transcriptional regulator [Gallionella sp.]
MTINIKRGRPRDPERMKRVLEAASEQFIAYGFAQASVDAIAKLSGVSKVTIYSYFPTKEALFAAAVGRITDTVFASLPPGALDPNNPEVALTMIGTSFLRLKRSDEVVGAYRMMSATAGEHTAACQAFYKQGPEKLFQQVAQYLRAVNAAGSLSIASPDEAADQFLALFLGSAHIRVMFGLGKPSAIEDANLVRSNVALFVRAFRV